MRFVEKLFIILILFFPLGELGRISFTPTVALSINDVLVFITVITWLGVKVKERSFQLSLLAKLLLLFWCVALISLFLSPLHLAKTEFLIALLYLVRFIFYSNLLLIVQDVTFNKKNLPKTMLVSGTVFVSVGVLQYVFFPDLRPWFPKGWDEHLYRLFGTFLDPNFTGTLLVLFFIFVSLLWQEKKIFLAKKLLGLLSVITLVSVFLTYSRSAIITLFLTTLVYLVIKKKFIWIGVVGAVFIVGLFLLSKTPRSEGTNLLRTASVSARSTSIQQAVTIFREHPVLGIGFDAYRYAQAEYGYKITSKFGTPVHSGAGTDNSFLFVLATTGVSGLFLYLSFLCVLLKKLYAATQDKKNILAMVGFLSLIALMIDSFFVNSLFYPFLMEWVFVVVGLGLVQKT